MNRPPARRRVAVLAAALAALQLSCLTLAAAAAEPIDGEPRDCIVEPMMTVRLGSREQGTIAAMNVERGKIVRKGEAVAELDSELQKLLVEVARIRAASDLDIQTAKAKLAFADTELGRARNLFATHVLPPKKFDEVTLDQAVAPLRIRRRSCSTRSPKPI